MHRIFTTSPIVQGDSAEISPSDLHHARDVLRLVAGERVTLVDPLRRTAVGIVETDPMFSVVAGEVAFDRFERDIILYMGLAKGDKFEFVVQKAVELGASSIVPVAFSRCVAKMRPNDEAKKLERLNRIAKSAAVQSGRSFVPEVGRIVSVEELAEAIRGSRALLAWELEKRNGIKVALAALDRDEKISLIVGPEGGIAEDEAEALTKAGAIPVSLGERILRCETAPIALLSIVQYLTGGMEPAGDG